MRKLESTISFINEMSENQFEIGHIHPNEHTLWDNTNPADPTLILYSDYKKMETYLEGIRIGIGLMINKYHSRQLQTVGGILSKLSDLA